MCSSRRLRDFALLPRLHLDEPIFQVADAGIDEAAVFFQLRFAGAARADAAAGAAEVAPHLPQARQGVFELGQLDLQACLDGAGARGEDVEDQLAAVEHFDVGRFFEVAHLRRRQVVVENDHVRVGGLDMFLQLFDLALADVGGGVDLLPFLAEAADEVAPAVAARPRNSSSGSSPTQGRSGRATLTRKAFSRWTDNSSRWLSRGTVCFTFSLAGFAT